MKKLTTEEKQIEKEMHEYQPASGEIKARIEKTIHNAKINKTISLRISHQDLSLLKQKASNSGVPYQTLLKEVLHKFVTNQLFEKEEVIKILKVNDKC